MAEEINDALFEELEAGLQDLVQEQLDIVSAEFLGAVDDATELVAAVFSVSRIREMWRRRVPTIMTRLRRIARNGAAATADDLGDPQPSNDALDAVLGPYETATRPLVEAVGDHLANAATQSLAEGVAAGETLEQLKARMRQVFNDTGAQLGPVRAERIASTEANRAWNAGVQAAAEALTGPQRPLVKQWRTMDDEKVRKSHRDANGQLRLLTEPFSVDGVEMQYPGDPTAPADQVINCRCRMVATAANERTASMGDDLSAAADVHTGAMIALMPSEADAQRLALDGGEPADQLHLTLCYLGEAADWTDTEQSQVRSSVAQLAGMLEPVYGHAFGAAQWNPDGDSPCWVWNVGDGRDPNLLGSTLDAVHNEIRYAVDGFPQMPQQHTPWSPHMAGVYTGDNMHSAMTAGVGPVTFDRIRVAFAGEYLDLPLVPSYVYENPEPDMGPDMPDTPVEDSWPGMPPTVPWSTPAPKALAFENQQTGDGRIFAPGVLYWDGEGPWPLQYADEMLSGHEGAELCGAIMSMARDGDRITGTGCLYLAQDAGWEAAQLLTMGAPLGTSVDLDDVSLELVDASTAGQAEAYRLKLLTASVMQMDDGRWWITGETEPTMTASGTGIAIESRRFTLFADQNGTVPGAAFELTAAAGDPNVDGVVVEEQHSGDYLMRITRGRIRGATLVTIPAFADAAIVLDDPEQIQASGADGDLAAAAANTDYERVARHLRKAQTPVTAADVARFLRISIAAARRYLAKAVQKGEAVRLSRGLYTAPTRTASMTLTASATGAVDLPVADRGTTWDGQGAETRVFDWADGDTAKISKAFAYREDGADPALKGSYKLGYADVVDGTLTIIPKGVSAAMGALNGARTPVDIPADQKAAVRSKLEAVQAHVNQVLGQASADTLEASAWSAMAELPPMPAAWFREPTAEELPPGGQGVNYSNGRIYGWVAQAGEPHAGFAQKVTIDGLGRIDTTHFLRQRFTLDDGAVVKAGAFTMNAGHHRDGAECETSSCQFDDTRTVAGIVTVGMNARGMWFSGAAAPWLSEWDRSVFAACQPSYHMRKGGNGQWQLRAVLSVPVPGHSSPLLASAVVERSQLALTAAATMVEVEDVVKAEKVRELELKASGGIDYDRLADSLVAAMERAEQRKEAEARELAELIASADTLDLDSTHPKGD